MLCCDTLNTSATHRSKQMTDRQYTMRAAQMKGLDLIKPTKECPGIIAYNMKQKDQRGIYPCIIDAKTWAEARDQLNNYYRA